MSLFSWFTRKPASAQSRMAEPSGLLNADATVPMTPGRDGKLVAQAAPAEHAANRKNERMERRELLYAVVRDAMVRAAVLSASYKFKVLSLDQRGRQFLVMMDLASEYGGDTARLSEIEALIAQTAKTRYDISVNAVYWRLNDHVAVGVPLQGVVPARNPAVASGAQLRSPGGPVRAPAAAAMAASAAAPVRAAASAAPAPTALAPRVAAAARFDPIEADEVAAFKQALASAGRPTATASPGVPVRSGPMRSSPLLHNDFADTEMPESDSRPQDLSGTQYGDL